MRGVVAVVAALVIGGSVLAAEPAPTPLGNEAQLAPANVTVKVAAVQFADDPTEVMQLEPGEFTEDQAGVMVTLDITSHEPEPFPLNGVFEFRLIDGNLQEHKTPSSAPTCGSPETFWLFAGELRPEATGSITVCWLVPADAVEGSFITLRWADYGQGEPVPFALTPAAGASPVASPAASPAP